MYLVTRQHGGAFPVEVEGLWTQLARRTRNINPILDFLLSLGMDTALQVRGGNGVYGISTGSETALQVRG